MLDINEAMLRVGAERAGTRFTGRIGLCDRQSEALPLPAESFDALHHRLRHPERTRIDAALKEAHRVLKPAGASSASKSPRWIFPPSDRIYDAYSFHVIPRLGASVAGDADSYRYLVESIRKFPPPAGSPA